MLQQTGVGDLDELIGLHAFAKLRVEILGGRGGHYFLHSPALLLELARRAWTQPA